MIRTNYYNYLYLDPEKPGPYKIKGLDIILTHEPFYVGKGTKNRWKHYQQDSCIKGKFLKNKLNILKKNNLSPIVILLIKNLTELESIENEKYLIKIIGRRDLNRGTLVNLTDGGDGMSGNIPTKESRIKAVETRRSRPRSEKELAHTKRLAELNRKTMKFRKHKTISILKIDKITNEILKEYNSIAEASRELGIPDNNIIRCCKKGNKTSIIGGITAGGFKWKYKNDI